MKAAQLLATALLLAGLGRTADAAEEYYEIDPEHTFSSFEYGHWGLSFQRSQFNDSRGYIRIDHEARTALAHIEIDTASINTGIAAFDQVLRSADFFDAERYPAMIFHSTRLQFDGEQLIQVEGELSIKDITRPVTLQVTHYRCRFMLIYGTRACGANASATISRSEFGLGRYTPFVSDQVTLHIMVEARLRP